MTVSKRCATVSTVQSENSSRSTCWMIPSVLLHVYYHNVNYNTLTTYTKSTLAVASSNTKIRFLLRRALAKQNNCL